MKQQGFTLIELMIVVVIIGVLAAIAYPSYRDYVLRSHRTDAKSALMATAQAMEKFYTEKMTYSAAEIGTANANNIASGTSPDGFYTISFDTNPSGAVCGGSTNTSPSANAYRICAVPTGTQASDSCGTFSISNTGVKTPSTARCWD